MLYEAQTAESIWGVDEDLRREMFRSKAARGASEALKAIQAEREQRDADEVGRKPFFPQSTTGRDILNEVCEYRKISVREVVSPGRHRYIVAVRHEAAYWMRARAGLSLPQIGRIMGGRDHTTIINACVTYANKHGLPQVAKRSKLHG